MALKFLIDENLHTGLVELAHAAGFVAEHVAHRGMAGWKDHEILTLLLDEEWTVVTNNGKDFEALLGDQELHPGLIVFVTNAAPRLQRALFSALLEYLEGRSDLVNRVVEVDLDAASKRKFSHRRRLSSDELAELVSGLATEIEEFERPRL